MTLLRNLLKRYPTISTVIITLLVVALGFFGLIAIANMSNSRSYSNMASVAYESVPPSGAAYDMAEAELAAEDLLLTTSNGNNQARLEPVQRVILRDASLTLRVESTDAAIRAITSLTDELGGWVVNANTNSSTAANGITYTNGNISVRVPAEQLDDVLSQIRGFAERVESETVNGRDVTEEYIDLSSRLTNLEAAERQLVSIMEDAYTVEDVLNVQAELTRVRGDIEVITGRLRYFDEAAAYSSINVTLREVIPSVGNVEVRGWNPLDTAANAFGSLIQLGQGAVDFIITVTIVWLPPLLVVGLVVVGLRRLWRRMRRNQSAS